MFLLGSERNRIRNTASNSQVSGPGVLSQHRDQGGQLPLLGRADLPAGGPDRDAGLGQLP